MRPATYPATALLLLCAPALMAQFPSHARASAGIPATEPTQTAPTQSVSDLPSAHPNAVATNIMYSSEIVWDGANLTIDATGEAMPELLGRIAHETGMKITGGVPDERVFGKYGPASVQVVLGQLFDGLAINMMLVNATATKPKELLLTVRSGAASPPSTRQVVENYQPRRQPTPIQTIEQHTDQQPPQGPPPQQRSNTSPSETVFPTSAPPTADSAATTSNGSSDSSQPQSPNGVKTPEQIFEELRKRQQQTAQ